MNALVAILVLFLTINLRLSGFPRRELNAALKQPDPETVQAYTEQSYGQRIQQATKKEVEVKVEKYATKF